MTNDLFETKIAQLHGQISAIEKDDILKQSREMPGKAFMLDEKHIVCLPRKDGDSRYPYGNDGFNFWAYASGNMHANEGLFSLFSRSSEGQEPKIAFFSGRPEQNGCGKSFAVASLLPVPVSAADSTYGIKRYSVLSPNAAYYLTHWSSLSFATRVFLSEDRTIHFSLLVENLLPETQRLFLSSFLNPFMRHQLNETDEDPWFKEVHALESKKAQGKLGSFIVKVSEDLDRVTSISYYASIRRQLQLPPQGKITGEEMATSRHQYTGGRHGNLQYPEPLYDGTFGESRPFCTFTETAIAGDLIHLELPTGQKARLDIAFAVADDEQTATHLAAKPIDYKAVDKALVLLEEEDHQSHSTMGAVVKGKSELKLKTPVFNTFFEHLKRQVTFCALIKGYIQLSPNSLIGIRDIFQAIEALIFWQPEAGRMKMLEAFDYTSPDGRCFRQYSLPSENGKTGIADLRPFIDQGTWVISTVATYLRVTGDVAFLDEMCGYHEIVDEKAGHIEPSTQKDSVLEHLLKIMDYLLEHRDHDETACVRALYGDWNDALDGLGVSIDPDKEYGSGVSVMVTLQVYQNTCEMVEMLTFIDAKKYAEQIKTYRKASEDLKEGLKKYAVDQNSGQEKRILHGWGDKRSYLVGSFSKDPDKLPRDGSTANAFWVLSGLYECDVSMKTTILNAFNRLDSKYGIKTFEPYFPEGTKGVGRIVKLPKGTAENGAAYIHATLFAIMALFKMGEARKGWEQLNKVLPFSTIHKRLSHSPFVMPNSYGYNPEKWIDGQSMNDWQTGSSNVLLKLFIRYIYGFEPHFKEIWIQPAAYFPFEAFDFDIECRGYNFELSYRKDKAQDERIFRVNGSVYNSVTDKVMGINKLGLPYTELSKGSSVKIEIIDPESYI